MIDCSDWDTYYIEHLDQDFQPIPNKCFRSTGYRFTGINTTIMGCAGRDVFQVNNINGENGCYQTIHDTNICICSGDLCNDETCSCEPNTTSIISTSKTHYSTEYTLTLDNDDSLTTNNYTEFTTPDERYSSRRNEQKGGSEK